ncbi:heterokaryon incompatibility protein-domain-containing protein [Boeremia exigua]|uniref:heterokaryon incompatibility protein-domain-containing protein n=1 Tax=Boeremia exigua TaxID=749465 RepID=UPI001E8DC420|nr:heterokaryon incompatibility protein-domain-containing protein [Boeremia exigua]KAH6625402.1 heterokaryon incompatibility protein-domain-containing protein [Boeremia exigua]
MYLLQVDTEGEFSLVEKYGEHIPSYAILSHTWIATQDEVTFKDVMKGRGKNKRGYNKLHFCAKQAIHDKLDYFWIDTCCIDKSSSAELQEAINSMFKWYQNSAKCYVYLTDVSLHTSAAALASHGWRSAFRQSRWFTRGWTLQELLAPTSVNFFTREGASLGDKQSLWQDINEATGIPPQILRGDVFSLYQVPVNDRLRWARNRQKTREEDQCYSLLGLFNVHMSLLYGEGRIKAFRRFHEELKKDQEDPTELNAILAQVQAQQFDRDDDVMIIPDNSTRPNVLKRVAEEAVEDSTYHQLKIVRRQARPETTYSHATGARVAQGTHADRLIAGSVDVPLEDTRVPDHRYNTGFDQEQAQARQTQSWWDEAAANRFGSPRAYSRVAVLLFKWANEIDELQTAVEVNDLEAMFRERFGFETDILELTSKKPQLQLNSRISSFAEKYNEPGNLIVVFYNGHAIWRDLENDLQLTAGSTNTTTASWNKAEAILTADDLDSDTLIILDACYSRSITKSQGSSDKEFSRKFELLSAGPSDETTPAPGPRSFTRSLINNLGALLLDYDDKPFSTFHLNQRLCIDRHNSQLWHGSRNNQHILLARMRSQKKSPDTPVVPQSRGRLTLSFDIRDETLTKEQTEHLATRLAKTFEHRNLLGVRKINWHGIERIKVLDPFGWVTIAIYAVVHWKNLVRRRRKERVKAV